MSESTRKRILITGGTGYLGSNIINSLKHRYNFIVLKRPSSSLERIRNALSDIELYDVDSLNEDVAEKLRIDIVLHCATHYGRKDTDPVNTIEANLLLPLRLLSIFKKTKHAVKFINTDTILDKNISVYSLSKNQFKDWMIFFSNDNAFINVQLEHFYGPQDDKTKFVTYLIDTFINNVPSLDLTKGEQTRYFTYIDDIVSAFEIILDNSDDFVSGFTDFQVSDDKPVNLKTFVQLVKKITGNTITQLNFGAVAYRKGELMNTNIDSSAIKALGWKPKIALEEGLGKAIEIDKKK
ncbi:NAD(P)-dependent oxidoreductase [Mucilaginibacter sp. HMF5004]|uniref:NAD-dependent epimerase/dehydratase family protein n=1 Tax=Mucilaginibacter rivuli TaxID=2857527 RepID=UPI001C602DBD|nr:NAD(P)-dependent oxidoreductase [Mucilaginibacter rivuli]MBW4889890.1 NAD(P)-dependent oxidoreductase [Mucilaginibacter rivuli]